MLILVIKHIKIFLNYSIINLNSINYYQYLSISLQYLSISLIIKYYFIRFIYPYNIYYFLQQKQYLYSYNFIFN